MAQRQSLQECGVWPMRISKLLVLSCVLALAVLLGACGARTPVTSSSASGGIVLLLKTNWAGDGRLVARHIQSGQEHGLLDLAFTDDNVRIFGFGWSPNGQRLGLILGTSRREANTIRVVVYDFIEFPDNSPKELLNAQRDAASIVVGDDDVWLRLRPDGRDVRLSVSDVE